MSADEVDVQARQEALDRADRSSNRARARLAQRREELGLAPRRAKQSAVEREQAAALSR